MEMDVGKKTGIANSKQHVIADGEMNGKSCVIICIPLCADIIIFKQHLAFTSTPNGPKWFKNEHLVLHMLQLFNALATLSRSISHSRIFSTGEKHNCEDHIHSNFIIIYQLNALAPILWPFVCHFRMVNALKTYIARFSHFFSVSLLYLHHFFRCGI